MKMHNPPHPGEVLKVLCRHSTSAALSRSRSAQRINLGSSMVGIRSAGQLCASPILRQDAV